MSHLKDTETGMRGYLISGDETFLEPFVAGKEMLKTDLVQLKGLIKSQYNSDTAFIELEKLINSKLNFSEQFIERRRQNPTYDVDYLTHFKEGKEIMDSIRAKIDIMKGNKNCNVGREQVNPDSNYTDN